MVLCLPIPVPIPAHWAKEPNAVPQHHNNTNPRGAITWPFPIHTCFVLALLFSTTLILLTTTTTNTTSTTTVQPPHSSVPALKATPHKSCQAPIFIDPLHNQQRRNFLQQFVLARPYLSQNQLPKPHISIIYITKRPGGYDILLHSLAQQQTDGPFAQEYLKSAPLYELICVDELAPYRAHRVYAMANELGVHVVAVVPSKPKNSNFRNLKFGIYNALNTGILLSRGRIATFLMDLGWLPSNFLERTLEFYSNPDREKSFLAYPERFYYMNEDYMPPQHKFNDFATLTIFGENQTTPFALMPERVSAGQARPEDMVFDFEDGNPRGFEQQPRKETGSFTFWELSFATCPFSVLEELNGVEEKFDYGDDCHENNIRLRSEFLGYDLWIDGQTVIQNLWHKSHFQPDGDRWNRFDQDSIQGDVLFVAIDQIRSGKRSVVSEGHDFDLTAWRKQDCALNVV